MVPRGDLHGGAGGALGGRPAAASGPAAAAATGNEHRGSININLLIRAEWIARRARDVFVTWCASRGS